MKKCVLKKLEKRIICLLMTAIMIFVGAGSSENSTGSSVVVQAATQRQCYLIGTSNVRAYSNASRTRAIGWIYPNDRITVYTVTGSYCYVSYPVGGGRVKNGYIATSAILLGTTGSTYKNNVGSFNVYIRPGAGRLGTSTRGDSVPILGRSGNYTQIKYPVAGGYKYGFALTSDVNRCCLSGGNTAAGGSKRISSAQAKAIMFNAAYYANSYRDLKAAFGYDANRLYNHYVTYGIKEGRSASPIFNPIYYLNNNADLKRAFGNNYVLAYNHFIEYGCTEGRASSPYYNGNYYRIKYRDLQRAFFSGGITANAYFNLAAHYLQYGISEKRKANYSGYIPTGMGQAANTVSNNNLGMPVPSGGKFSRKSQDGSWYGYHDINRGVSASTPVYAVCDGTVTYKQAYTVYSGVKKLTSYGNFIEFTSSNRVYTAKYCHLSRFVGANQIISSSRTVRRSGSSGVYTIATRSVKKGQIIGYIGTTGNSSGVHLHFELRRNGTRIDPTSVIGGLI